MDMSSQPDPGAEARPVDPNERELLRSVALRLRLPLVQFFHRRVRNGAEAEDLVQEVFERLARHQHLHVVERLDGYVFTIATNLLRDRARRRLAHAAAAHVSMACAPEGIEEITPERVLTSTEAMDRFLAALAELPDRTRVILLLRRYEGLEFKEIACRVGVSVSAAEKHVARAMEHLSRRLDLK
ncbi:MAG: RNA polymerase sigma factor [Proteobacteria bacterium]|nr:RNA polymerase sigma factor [Pseudomonadota bacterium]